jgi:hypothetical protein
MDDRLKGIRSYVNRCKAESEKLTPDVDAMNYLIGELDKSQSKLSQINGIIMLIIFGVILLGGLSIGGYLVINNHPWFGLLIIIIVAGLRIRWK